MSLGGYNSQEVVAEIKKLLSADTRGPAVQKVLAMSSSISNLGAILWHAPGVALGLLQDIVTVLPIYEAGLMTKPNVDRITATLYLFTIIASDPLSQSHLLASHIPATLFPFLSVASETTEETVVLTVAALSFFISLANPDPASFAEFAFGANLMSFLVTLIEQHSGAVLQLACLLTRTVATSTNGPALMMESEGMLESLTKAIDMATARAVLPSTKQAVAEADLASVAAMWHGMLAGSTGALKKTMIDHPPRSLLQADANQRADEGTKRLIRAIIRGDVSGI
ncbi:cell differentiation protein RCD1 [Carpediemonas membranifera]|uniref:Cell differentiation protein RCD1 n=1 Tax=Carpediemonas membranifera TaxID=201153 RepID=A0A8J6E6J2_9EUKA|nr:cell differentiation protein RCD1 [Carpediemonas membranifera]|eukprot:KAG9389620.1 cell differentiation protein RCD1 [Carpediemonas membranifera]